MRDVGGRIDADADADVDADADAEAEADADADADAEPLAPAPHPTDDPPMLLLLLACAGPKGDTVAARADDTGAPDHTGAPDDSGPPDHTDAPDADADGAPADQDCDDADPTRHPGAAEVCDGVDQDCDGQADDGIVTDGAGCRDPGPPADDGAVDLVTLTLRTNDDATDGSDDGGLEICLAADWCVAPFLEDWDDRQVGAVDVYHFPGDGRAPASFDRFRVRTSDGSDQWDPAGWEVALDGVPVHCDADPGIKVGDASGEEDDWTDPDGLHLACTTVFDTPLASGPLVGMGAPGEARLWFRTHATTRVAVYVADREADLATAAPVAIGYPRADDDFTWEAHLQGVTPGLTWFYAVEIDGVRLGPWSFRAPPAGPSVSRLAFGSCARDELQPMFGTLLGLDPDLFVFAGDNHYANSDDLDSLRAAWRWAHARVSRDTLLRTRPILATWDDHDFVGNDPLGTAPGKEWALQAFLEYHANPSAGLDGVPGVFSVARWGDVDVVLLDDRYHRDVDGTMLGAEQEAWLVDTLAASTAPFKLVVSGSQWTQEGNGDSWWDFPADWDRLTTALIERRIDGVVLLSGDVHRSELRALPGAAGGYTLPELTSSPLANSASGCGTDAELRACYDDGPSAMVLDIDTTLPDPTLSAWIVDLEGAEVARWTIAASALTVP